MSKQILETPCLAVASDLHLDSSPPTEIFLPDFEAGWKWPRRINPHTPDIKDECLEWAAGFHAFTPQAQIAFDRCDFNLLTGLSYPNITRDQLRAACYLMNLFFIFDEHSDRCKAAEVWEQVHIIMDAMKHPDKPRPADEWVGGEVARDFWARAMKISTKTFQRRFLDVWEKHLHGTAQQAEDRGRAYIRDIGSYFEVRRRTIGALPSFAIFEMDMGLPDYVLDHAIIQELTLLSTDLTIIANDVISYNKEQASGDNEHNLITIIMHETGKGLQEALDWAGQMHADRVRKFNQLYMAVPRWGGPLDRDVQVYLDGMAQWVVAYVQWSFESERYFGKRGPEVMKTRRLHLLPKKKQDVIGPIVVDAVLL